jgi:hypothetical protein
MFNFLRKKKTAPTRSTVIKVTIENGQFSGYADGLRIANAYGEKPKVTRAINMFKLNSNGPFEFDVCPEWNRA